MKARLHLLGAGRAGRALLRLLRREGHPVGFLVTRSEEAARGAFVAVGGGVPSTSPQAAFESGAITIIGLPESSLAPMAAKIAPLLPPLQDAIALHMSGSLPAEVLAPLRTRGIAIGSCHPLASFADRDRLPDSLEGTTFDVDGDPAARKAAGELARSLHGHVVELGPDLGADGKALFHAAACVASNSLVALFDLATRLAEIAGASPLAARSAMAALAASTLDNLVRSGSPAALTGPIERGEAAVIERHLAALARRAPGERARYVELSRATLEVAMRKGALTPEQSEALRRLLEAGGPGAPGARP